MLFFMFTLISVLVSYYVFEYTIIGRNNSVFLRTDAGWRALSRSEFVITHKLLQDPTTPSSRRTVFDLLTQWFSGFLR